MPAGVGDATGCDVVDVAVTVAGVSSCCDFTDVSTGISTGFFVVYTIAPIAMIRHMPMYIDIVRDFICVKYNMLHNRLTCNPPQNPYLIWYTTLHMDTQQTTHIQPSVEQAKPKLGKFATSYTLVRESWSILKQDTELLWFPVLSALTSLVALIAFGALFFFTTMGGDMHALEYSTQGEVQRWGYAGLFVYYIVMFFITNYFLAGVYTIVHGRFNGQDLTFTDGIQGANKNMDKIFIWSLISATVGLVLRFISDRSEIAGRIIAAIFGAAWGILTYFSLPSLVIGQKDVKESFKESAALIRKTWGEAFIMNIGVGLFFIVLFFVGTALSIGVCVLIPLPPVWLLVGILYVVFVIGLIVVSSTLGTIYRLALYEYALTGKVPEGFSEGVVRG